MKTFGKLQGHPSNAHRCKLQKASSRPQSKRRSSILYEESITYLFGPETITRRCMMKDVLDYGACSVRLASSKDRLLARFCCVAAVLILFAFSFI